LTDDLFKEIREQARRICEEIYSPACFKKGKMVLSPVQLQISKAPKPFDSEYDDTGHYCRRKDFERMYEQPRGDITDEEMLDLAKQEAVKEAESKWFQNEEERDEYIARHGNVIGVIGNPGIGKSTSAKKWIGQFLCGELLTTVSFLFFIIIRKLKFNKEMNLLEFLLSSILPTWKHTTDSDEFWLKKIVSDRHVVIVFDGFDEASVLDSTIEAPTVNIHKPEQPLHILLNLISGTLLPYARVIVTSRPNQFYHIHTNHKPRFVVEILGLDEKGRDKIGQQICPKNYEHITEILRKDASVFAYCYVPVNFILTLHYLMESSSDKNFVSMTKVLASACGKYARGEQLRDKIPKVAELSKLAWIGFCRRQIVFEKNDFKQVDLDDATVQSFLSTSLVDTSDGIALKIMDGDKRIYFSHLIWQEFFVAFYLMLVALEDEFEEVSQRLFDDRWEVVSKCLHGLCNASVMKPLTQSTNICNKPSLWKKKKELLTRATAIYLEQLSSHATKSNEGSASEGFLLKYQEIQAVCSWIYEANEKHIIEKLVPLIADHIWLDGGTILPSDISNLYFVIDSFPKSWKVDVDNCRFHGNAMERFCSEASRLNTMVGICFFCIF